MELAGVMGFSNGYSYHDQTHRSLLTLTMCVDMKTSSIDVRDPHFAEGL